VWRLSNGRLIQKESEKPYIEANKVLRESAQSSLGMRPSESQQWLLRTAILPYEKV